MLRQMMLGTLAMVMVLSMAACQRAPVTGRRQLLLIGVEQEASLGEQAFRQVLSEEKLSDNAAANAALQRVGQRIAAAAEEVHDLRYAWEFRLIESEEMNAFALPGGKVAVYTGILPYAKNEAGLAAIIGHEVSHVIARHGAERMSQGLVAQLAGTGAQIAASGLDPRLQAGVMAAYGAGAQLGVLLPYSRLQESEADAIGLRLSARAGYDPREAVGLWSRMAEAETSHVPTFLRTHPQTKARIEKLEEMMPRMQAIYDGAPVQYGTGDQLPINGTTTSPR